jgi:hypothetical protein
MSNKLRRLLHLSPFVIAAAVGAFATTFRGLAPTVKAGQGNAPVRTVGSGQALDANPGRKGATYYWLEGRSTRVTTKFSDGTSAVAERASDGNFESKLNDTSGNELSRLKIVHLSGANTALQYRAASGAALNALGDGDLQLSLAWSNAQAHSLWKEGSLKTLEWQDGYMRPAGAGKRDLGEDIVELHTEWANGLSATGTRKAATTARVNQRESARTIAGPALTTTLTKDGANIGAAAWFPNDKLFMWNLPNLTQAYIDSNNLSHFGGWPFTPDAEWLNLQILALYHFKTQINEKGFVARVDQPCTAPSPGLLARVANFFEPTLRANDPGCDNLHWLDGTVFRQCCDIHDACYAAHGCNWYSWWKVWTSWTCDMCNGWVAFCFASTACTCDPGFALLEIEEPLKTRVAQGTA